MDNSNNLLAYKVKIEGGNVYFTEVKGQGDSKFSVKYTFSKNYKKGKISGSSKNDDPNECQGKIKGSFKKVVEFFFEADDGINDFELWKTDGTEAGTFMIKDIYPGSGSCCND